MLPSWCCLNRQGSCWYSATSRTCDDAYQLLRKRPDIDAVKVAEGRHIFCAAGDDDELSQFTPSFLWLLRDFYLALEEDGRKVSPGEYLESALQPVKGAGRSVEAKNAVSSTPAVHKLTATLQATSTA